MASRKKKIFLGIFIPIVIFGLGLGGINLGIYIKYKYLASLPAPEIDFPIANTEVIHIIWGYGDHEGNFHDGIDYGNNQTMAVVAWCDLEVGEIEVWYNEGGGHWQVNTHFIYNKRYGFGIGFESWALNESYALLQRDALAIDEGDILEKGDFIGNLLVHGSGSHIHFGMYDESLKENKTLCAYNYFSESAKTIFNTLWDFCGYGDDFWYTG
jgi:murein DD-endopeptidase MepM/ murein hydrolase activator NlpD